MHLTGEGFSSIVEGMGNGIKGISITETKGCMYFIANFDKVYSV